MSWGRSPTLGAVPIVVRSLRCVGGDRPGKRYSRRANRKLRAGGMAGLFRARGLR